MIKKWISSLKFPSLRLGYSGKVKIIILWAAMMAFYLVLALGKTQMSFTNALQIQKPGVDFFKTWTDVAVSIQKLSLTPTQQEFNAFNHHFEELKSLTAAFSHMLFEENPKTQLKLSGYMGEIEQLGSNSFLQLFTPEDINTRLDTINASLATIILDRQGGNLGDDIPTYVLASFVLNKLALNQKIEHDDIHYVSLLTGVLHTLPIDLLPHSPGSILDAIEIWADSNPKDLSNLILQSKLVDTLQKVMQSQLSTLEFRQNFSLFAILIGLMIVLMFYSTRVIRTPLADLRYAAQQLAKGDLQQRAKIDSYDEVSKMCAGFNSMATLLEKAVNSTSVVSDKLTETISTITGSAKSFEQNVSDQEKTIAQIAENTEGITKTADEVVIALDSALQVAMRTLEFAKYSQESIRSLEDVLKETGTAAQQIIETLYRLGEKVASLGDIISTIVNVADEANLLYINTALISHSATHRRSGFGIISNKISELASQTAGVTLRMEDSIKAILNALSRATSQVHDLARNMPEHREAAARLVRQFMTMMEVAKKQTETCAYMQEEILNQQKSATQIHDTITQLSQGARINTRSVRNLYSQIKSLGEASSNLQIILDRFHLHRKSN